MQKVGSALPAVAPTAKLLISDTGRASSARFVAAGVRPAVCAGIPSRLGLRSVGMIIKTIAIIGCCIIAAGYILDVAACIRMRYEDQLLDQ